MRPLLILAALSLGCAPKPAPVAATPIPAPAAPSVAPTRLTAPGPLAEGQWTLPTAAVGALSNGIPVYVVENHEVPLVAVRMTFGVGSDTDPKGKEGLAQATMAMLTRGAGSYDVEGLNRALRKLGSDLNVGASTDDASISISSLTRNLGPSLDLVATVLTAPTFPAAEWTLLAKQYKDSVAARRKDPTSKAWTALDVVTFGNTYQGRVGTEKTIDAIKLADMKAWRSQWLTAKGAALFVGGDTSLAEVLPLLEARFGKLPGGTKTAPAVATPAKAAGRPLAIVDEPGASQSIILASRYLGRPTDPGYLDLLVANSAWGGMFTSRLNMNLREDKGYTYGARSSVDFDAAGTRFTLSAPVQADKTIPALQEILKELADAAGPRPFTDVEIENARGSILESYPLPFENPGQLLGLLGESRRYALGESWIPTWTTRIRAVTTATANDAWKANVDGTGLHFVVVGDAATLREPLRSLGFAVEERDADGALVHP